MHTLMPGSPAAQGRTSVLPGVKVPMMAPALLTALLMSDWSTSTCTPTRCSGPCELGSALAGLGFAWKRYMQDQSKCLCTGLFVNSWVTAMHKHKEGISKARQASLPLTLRA